VCSWREELLKLGFEQELGLVVAHFNLAELHEVHLGDLLLLLDEHLLVAYLNGFKQS